VRRNDTCCRINLSISSLQAQGLVKALGGTEAIRSAVEDRGMILAAHGPYTASGADGPPFPQRGNVHVSAASACKCSYCCWRTQEPNLSLSLSPGLLSLLSEHSV
jgi:hypothetical protein